MALSTYDSIVRGVLLRCPIAGLFLARDWVNTAFRNVAERRQWSWLRKSGQAIFPDAYSTGNVDVTQGSQTVTGHSTVFTAAMVGRQFRIGTTYPIYDISDVDVGAQTLTLSLPWGGGTLSAQGYVIYLAFVPMPTDFHAFVSVYDPQYNWQLWSRALQEELNAYDAQRATSGVAYIVAHRDYDTSTPPLPRYEWWPHQRTAKVYPYLYESRATDLTDANASLPRFIRGDVLLEGALEQCALWPGPSRDQPNPYFNLNLSMTHKARFEKDIIDAERQDDDVNGTDAQYQQATAAPYAPVPWLDSRWLQSHAPVF